MQDAAAKPSPSPSVVNGLLILGDLICFLIFATIGLRSHEEGITASGILRAAVPFQAAWLVFSLVTGLHKQRDAGVKPIAMTLVPTVVIGVIARSLFFGRPFAPTFGIVALIFNFVALTVWRRVIAPRVVKTRA
jgi:hypothetical protein